MKTSRGLFVILIVGCLGASFGCQSETPAPPAETVQPRATEQPAATAPLKETMQSNGVEQPKTAFTERIEHQLAELDTNIDALQDKAAELPADSKEEFNQMMRSLQSQKQVVEERLETLKAGSIEGWETLKTSTEEALTNLQGTYDQLAARFQ